MSAEPGNQLKIHKLKKPSRAITETLMVPGLHQNIPVNSNGEHRALRARAQLDAFVVQRLDPGGRRGALHIHGSSELADIVEPKPAIRARQQAAAAATTTTAQSIP